MITKTKKKTDVLTIPAPNMEQAEFQITGTSPYVQHNFSGITLDKMLADQMEGSQAKNKKRKHPPRNIEADYLGAQRLTRDGKNGIPATAFRGALISACRLVGFQMTKAKLSIFVHADDFDASDGTPLVYIQGTHEMLKSRVVLASGVSSIAIRPIWRKWSAKVRIQFDADQFQAIDVLNLLVRVGMQVGIGEGRPDSKKSHGMGWGLFSVSTSIA